MNDVLRGQLVALLNAGADQMAEDRRLIRLRWDIRREGVSTELVGRTAGHLAPEVGLRGLQRWAAVLGLVDIHDDDGRFQGWAGTFDNVAVVLPAAEQPDPDGYIAR